MALSEKALVKRLVIVMMVLVASCPSVKGAAAAGTITIRKSKPH